jgi:16S rRNA (uracil1498-N3)-methyltransferase
MSRYDFRTPRVHTESPLSAGQDINFNREQANYLLNVLRLKSGDPVLLFNGRDGEWRAQLALSGKRSLTATPDERLRAQPRPNDLHFLFAPLKHARLDYMVQKAVEMGVCTLQPVLTRFTQVTRVNGERMRANVIEAAEQCGILSLARVEEPVTLDRWLSARAGERLLVFCDEAAPVADPAAALAPMGSAAQGVDVLVGPEGGFAEDERANLLRQPNTLRLSLGPRILRADTAAVAVLALVQTVLGDWTQPGEHATR